MILSWTLKGDITSPTVQSKHTWLTDQKTARELVEESGAGVDQGPFLEARLSRPARSQLMAAGISDDLVHERTTAAREQVVSS